MLQKKQVDILKEMINIGIGDAAATLSDLVKSRVVIKVPDLKVMTFPALVDYFEKEIDLLGVYISQKFKGAITGKSLLCYSREASLSLLRAVAESEQQTLSLSDSEKSILQEIGNLLLVSCISAISNILEDLFVFEIPHVAVSGQVDYFEYLIKDMKELEQAVVVKTTMAIKGTGIDGYIFILIGFKGLQSMVSRMERRITGEEAE